MLRRRWVLFLAVLALYAVDPYSYGRAGAQTVFSGRPWQVIATAGLAALIIIAAILVYRGRHAALILGLEAVGFLALNIAFIARDGGSRFVFGYEQRPIGVLAVVGGIVFRIMLYRALSMRSAQRPRGDPRGQGQPQSLA